MEQQQHDKIFCFGSAELDQFQTQREGVFEMKRGVEQEVQGGDISVVGLAAGGSHSMVLDTLGRVFSWGLADEGQLGRDETDCEIHYVPLPVPVDLIAAGDCFSVAVNTAHSLVYFWGCFRNNSGQMGAPVTTPTLIERGQFKNKTISKVVCGANHCLLLADRRIYSWGDSDTAVLGRRPLARRKKEQEFRVEATLHTNVLDVWAGAYHNFAKVLGRRQGDQPQKVKYMAWGLNQYGQLGIGSISAGGEVLGKEIKAFQGQDVLDIRGGEHHSVALLKTAHSTKVMSWGRNDDNQCGLGDLQHDFKEDEEIIDEHVIRSPHSIPQLEDKDVSHLSCMEHANYAYTENGLVFSWGINSYCKLGTMNEDNQESPYQIKPNFIINPKLDNEQHKLLYLSLGGQHVVFITGHTKQYMDQSLLHDIPAHLKSTKMSRKTMPALQQHNSPVMNPIAQKTRCIN